MSFVYEIATGRLYDDLARLAGTGYSGSPAHKNDVTAQSLKDLGPIPEGTYTIGDPVDTVTHGPYVLPLTPDPSNEMFGRSGFLIHGDSVVAPGTASEGCIILGRAIRNDLGTSDDRKLRVVDVLA